MTEKEKLGKKIKQLRTKKGWTQEEMAKVLDSEQSTVCRWEKGTAAPEYKKLMKIRTMMKKAGIKF